MSQDSHILVLSSHPESSWSIRWPRIKSAHSSVVMNSDPISPCLTDSTIDTYACCIAEPMATNADTARSTTRQGSCTLNKVEQLNVTRQLQQKSSRPEVFKSGNIYEDLYTSGRACQINGDISEGSTQLRKHRYFHVTATGSSLQINGNIDSSSLIFLSTSVNTTSWVLPW